MLRIAPPQWVVLHFCTDTAKNPASSVSGCALLYRYSKETSLISEWLCTSYRYSKETSLLSEWLCTSVQIQQRNPPTQWVVVHFCTNTAKKPATSVSGCALLYRYSKDYRSLKKWLCTSVQMQQRNPHPQWAVVHFWADTVKITAPSKSGCALLYRYSKETSLLVEWSCHG